MRHFLPKCLVSLFLVAVFIGCARDDDWRAASTYSMRSREHTAQNGFSAVSLRAHIWDIVYLDPVRIPPGQVFPVAGKGFRKGDSIRLIREDMQVDCQSNVLLERVEFVVPEDLPSGEWEMRLVRGTEYFSLGSVTLTISADAMPLKRPGIVAHRGFHSRAPENSLESLRLAQELGCYGSETDIWMSKDGEAFIFHDESVDNHVIRETDAQTLKRIRLYNGETLPTLNDYLAQATKNPACVPVLEIKDHLDDALSIACAAETVRLVRAHGLQDHVMYISFSLPVCEWIASAVKGDAATIGYLPRTTYDFDSLQQAGILNLDFYYLHVLENPDYPSLLSGRGMSVNVWTLVKPEEIMQFLPLGVDYITTDIPDYAETLCRRLFD